VSDTTQDQGDANRASGRFVLRIDPGLHAALRAAARNVETSLNEYCARKLALPTGSVAGPASEAVTRAAALVGDALLGVVAFGSWARRELAQTSDVDLMIIVDQRFDIDREIYRRWDVAPLRWNDHPVEPHFVHLPRPGARISGTWAEVAVDGVVLFERGLTVSRRLVELRQKVVSGGVVRRRSHGQSYWVEVT
jgi:hypothetical protein